VEIGLPEALIAQPMSNDRPKRDTMSIDEATISNLWEIAAIVDVPERKGLCTKQNLYDIVTELRPRKPHASIPETAFPARLSVLALQRKVRHD
jgi:hypothetical protein